EGGISLVSCLRGRGAIRKLSYDALLNWKSVKHERRPRYAIPHLLVASDLRSDHFAGHNNFNSFILLPALGRAVVATGLSIPKPCAANDLVSMPWPPARTGETPVALCAVEATTDNVLPFSLAAATGEEVVEQRLDAIGQLYRAERALSNLQSSRVFQAFSDRQKYEYFQVLGDVRSLIREISKQSVESKVASEVSLLQNTTRTHITKNLMTASSNLRLRSGLRH